MADKPPATALDRLRAGLGRRNGSPAGGPAPEPDPPKSPAAPPPPGPPPAPGANAWRAAQETIDYHKARHREELSETRRRINLTWMAAAALAGVIAAGAALLYFPAMNDDRFRSFWPWRHHVWSHHGGHVVRCINKARQINGTYDCYLPVHGYGPDCPKPEAEGAASRCSPWEGWPTDPAPRWSAPGG